MLPVRLLVVLGVLSLLLHAPVLVWLRAVLIRLRAVVIMLRAVRIRLLVLVSTTPLRKRLRRGRGRRSARRERARRNVELAMDLRHVLAVLLHMLHWLSEIWDLGMPPAHRRLIMVMAVLLVGDRWPRVLLVMRSGHVLTLHGLRHLWRHVLVLHRRVWMSGHVLFLHRVRHLWRLPRGLPSRRGAVLASVCFLQRGE